MPPRRLRGSALWSALALVVAVSGCRAAGGSAEGPRREAPPRALAPAADGAQLPERLADSTWWRMVNELSEPGGFFRSENFVSNELGVQHVVARLRQSAPPGGVYLGVGPEQNFTYIAALEPRIAFIVDIRRQNLLQHLWYKAVFELSPTRAEFLSRLFARPLAAPARVSRAWPADTLIAQLERTPPDSALFRRTFEEVRAHLVNRRGLTLSAADLGTLRYVDSVFYLSGPELNYSSGGTNTGMRNAWRRMPSFGEVARATDTAGRNLGFLGSEAQYRIVRDLQRRNLVIPVVGNFAGPRALGAVGDWLRERNARVNVFYTSNVEQYLFQQGDEWQRFYANVGRLPLDSAARFIRSVTGGYGVPRSGLLMTQLTSEIAPIVRDAAVDRLGGYGDVIRRSTPN
jgi:hypothetical protein